MSNLIALKDNNNDIGLGTSFISLGTNIGTSVLPFKKNDETILIDFNATNNSINLPTIESGTWQEILLVQHMEELVYLVLEVLDKY